MAKETGKAQAVKVVCRLRPRLPCDGESEAGNGVVEVRDEREVVISDPSRGVSNRFDFSRVYGAESTQDDIFRSEVEGLLDQVHEGISTTIFAYGCTGSGKTHTLQGTTDSPGLIPRTVQAIFDRSPPSASIAVSYFEILKDKVWDLLSETMSSDRTKGDLPIRENAQGQVFVSQLHDVPVPSVTAFNTIYARATRARTVAATKLNHASSRSHAVLTLTIETEVEGGRKGVGKCRLIDLAGSEDNKRTGNEASKERMRESVEINQSLLTLRKVVTALNDGESRIPYRDSKLTRILSDALGGESSALVICNISPCASSYRDTMNTLTFGSLSRNVENRVVAVTAQADIPLSKNNPAAPVEARRAGRTMPASRSSTGTSLAEPTRSAIRAFGSRASDPTRPARPLPAKSRISSGAESLTGDASSSTAPTTVVDVSAEPVASTSAPEDLEEKLKRLMEGETQKMRKVLEEQAERMRVLEAKLLEAGMKAGEAVGEAASKSGKSKRKRSDEAQEAKRRVAELEHQIRREIQQTPQRLNIVTSTPKAKSGQAYLMLALDYERAGDYARALRYYSEASKWLNDKKKVKRRANDLRECLSRKITLGQLERERKAKAASRVYIDLDDDGEATSKGKTKARRRAKDVEEGLQPACILPVSLESVLQQARTSPSKPAPRRSKATPPPESDLQPRDRARLEGLILAIVNEGDAKDIQQKLKTVGAKKAADLAEFVDEEGTVGSFADLRGAGLSAKVLNNLVLANAHLLEAA